MTRCRHTGPVLILERCLGWRIHHPNRALPEEVLDAGPAEHVKARCVTCGNVACALNGDSLPAWAQAAWRRARG